MSDTEPTPPTTPGPGSPPPPPPPSPGPSSPPTPSEPSTPSMPEPEPLPHITEMEPTSIIPPTYEPTAQMPALPPDAGGAVPPIYPPDTGYQDPAAFGDEPLTPWYQKPGAIAVLVLVVLAIAGLIAWLIFGGGDDEGDESPDSSRLILEVSDGAGGVVDRDYAVQVVGPTDAPGAFSWLRPDDAPLGDSASDSTGTDGRVDFEWQPDDTVTDPAGWAATVSILEGLPAGWTPAGPVVDCVLERPDTDERIITMNATVDGDDPTVDRFVVYSFADHQFLPGDTVTCELVSAPPAPTETTIVDTTVVDTTVVESTIPETTAPPTTLPPTTVPPATTVPVVTVPPQPAATLWDVIDASPDLSGIKAWIEQAGLEAEFQDPDANLTLLAPSNQAIADAPAFSPTIDFDDTANLLLILYTHLNETEVLLAGDIAGLAEIEVIEPGPHAVDADADPLTIGGADVLLTDVEASNGVIHVISRVLIPEALAP